MIAKVLRGQRASGLLKYLFGPGEHNEHLNPGLELMRREPVHPSFVFRFANQSVAPPQLRLQSAASP